MVQMLGWFKAEAARASRTGQVVFGLLVARIADSGFALHAAVDQRQFGQPKIQNLGVPPVGHKNICRLDIPVDDSLTVCCIQSFSHFNSQIQQFLQLHRLSIYQVL